MSELIKNEITKVQKGFEMLNKSRGDNNISENRAFLYVLLKYIFKVDDIEDQEYLITDGANDGGIDFIYYDDNNDILILCQAKYTKSLSINAIEQDLTKMYNTLQNFRKSNTGKYNDKLRNVLQNALDGLPEGKSGNVEYNYFTTAPINIADINNKLHNGQHVFPLEAVKFFLADDIEIRITDILEDINTVSEAKIKLDEVKKYT